MKASDGETLAAGLTMLVTCDGIMGRFSRHQNTIGGRFREQLSAGVAKGYDWWRRDAMGHAKDLPRLC